MPISNCKEKIKRSIQKVFSWLWHWDKLSPMQNFYRRPMKWGRKCEYKPFITCFSYNHCSQTRQPEKTEREFWPMKQKTNEGFFLSGLKLGDNLHTSPPQHLESQFSVLTMRCFRKRPCSHSVPPVKTAHQWKWSYSVYTQRHSCILLV